MIPRGFAGEAGSQRSRGAEGQQERGAACHGEVYEAGSSRIQKALGGSMNRARNRLNFLHIAPSDNVLSFKNR